SASLTSRKSALRPPSGPTAFIHQGGIARWPGATVSKTEIYPGNEPTSASTRVPSLCSERYLERIWFKRGLAAIQVGRRDPARGCESLSRPLPRDVTVASVAVNSVVEVRVLAWQPTDPSGL